MHYERNHATGNSHSAKALNHRGGLIGIYTTRKGRKNVAVIAPRDEPNAPETSAKSRSLKRSAHYAGWCCTFPNDLTGIGLLHSAIAQVVEFTADEFYVLAKAGV